MSASAFGAHLASAAQAAKGKGNCIDERVPCFYLRPRMLYATHWKAQVGQALSIVTVCARHKGGPTTTFGRKGAACPLSG